MNCLELRRAVMAGPRRLDEAASTHVRECPECAGFVERTRRLEDGIERALRLPVPEGLGARILLRRSIAHGRPPRGRRIALAACVLATAFLAALAVRMTATPARSAALAAEVAAYAAQSVDVPAAGARTPAAIEALLTALGIRLGEQAGPIAAARPCVIENAEGAHLVVDTAAGPVTVLVLPRSDITAPFDFPVGDGLRGRLLPCPRGSIALIGADPAQLDELQRRFEGAVVLI